MIKKLWNKFFGKKKPTIQFRSTLAPVHVGTPVKEARKVFPAWAKKQFDKKEYKFSKCPGMFDMAQMGYIIPAWTDLHIKANKQGAIIKAQRPIPGLNIVPMDVSVVEGLAPVRGVPQQVWKVEVPWAIFCKEGYSAMVIPAMMHSAFLGKIHVYAGIVDYDDFQTINFIITVLEECEFTIWAGEPLLQVIPFQREEITADCGKASQEEMDKFTYGFYSKAPSFYRKMFHKKKTYTMDYK